MTRKRLLTLFGSICLVLMIAALPFMAACPAPPEEVTPPPPEDGEEPPPPPPPPEEELQLPDHLVFGSMLAAGTAGASNVVLVSVWEKYLGIPVIFKQTGGAEATLPMMEAGEVDTFFEKGPDFLAAFHGTDPHERKWDIRVLFSNPYAPLGWCTLEKNNIKTVHDLAGKTVAVYSSRGVAINQAGYATMDWAGITDKVTDLRDMSVGDRYKNLAEGRIAAYFMMIGRSWEEYEAKMPGFTIVNLPKECGDYVAEHNPAIVWGKVKDVSKRRVEVMGWPPDTTLLWVQNSYWVMSTMPDHVAYELVKIFYEHHDELVAGHPSWVDFSLEANAYAQNVLPYHPGAIKYYKEKGIWTAEMDVKQAKILAGQ